MDVSKFSSGAVGALQRICGHDSYLQRDYDHFAFVPAPLPAALALDLPTVKLMAEAERAVGRLDAAVAPINDDTPVVS